MTKEDATIIRGWRVAGSSWRRIAERAAEMWPEKEYEHGNQIQGIVLCDEAALTLGERPNEEPWN